MDILREISTDMDFSDVQISPTLKGEPQFMAFGCMVIERKTSAGYAYIAVNTKTGAADVLVRRRTFISANDDSAVRNLLEKLRTSTVAGYGMFEADRRFGEHLTLTQAKEILLAIFKEVLPEYGYSTRREQIDLAVEMLEAINRCKIMLAEGETGTGKTLAYLIAAIIAKRGRLNDFWNMGYYPKMQYSDMAHMPIVVATSSIALQQAIVTDYIPKISNILLAMGIIKTPITSVLRKGRGHYLCKQKLKAHMPSETDPQMHVILQSLLKKAEKLINVDLLEVKGVDGATLSKYTKSRICVPNTCELTCPHYFDCGYLDFRKTAESRYTDIQVCNHQYLLADTLKRIENRRAELIPNYQSIIIDEAHRLLSAAQMIYGTQFSSNFASEIKRGLDRLRFEFSNAGFEAQEMGNKLYAENKQLFRELSENSYQTGEYDSFSKDNKNGKCCDESERLSIKLSDYAIDHLCNLCDIADDIIGFLEYSPVVKLHKGYKSRIINDLKDLIKQAELFMEEEKYIFWFEAERFSKATNLVVKYNGSDSDCDDELENIVPNYSHEMKICAVPKNLDKFLYEDLFSKGLPIILTSGTLSTNAVMSDARDFSHVKRTLGISNVNPYRVTETSKASPFDYFNNTLLYLSENLPFPNNKDPEYIFALANEIEQLIYASHGHSAILFTSYRAMDMIWEHLAERDMPFPMFSMSRGGTQAINNFKQSKNGVLFASGSMWEGIDISGDTLSMVIIPKLPFPSPDPISEYERTLYPSFRAYRIGVIEPEMAINLKQGDGRLVRTESDNGVIAILDCRANLDGAYYDIVCKTLPKRRTTNSVNEIAKFFKMVKPCEYFIQ